MHFAAAGQRNALLRQLAGNAAFGVAEPSLDIGPLPTALTAATLKKYIAPFVSPGYADAMLCCMIEPPEPPSLMV